MKKRLFKTLKRGMAVTLAVSLVTGLAPVNTGPGRSSVKEAEAAEALKTSGVMGSDNYVEAASIEVGSTYWFDRCEWIAAEDRGYYIVLQSKGVTSGKWPGYRIWGHNSDYRSDIDGQDISSYDTATKWLYNDIKYAEYGSSGLYLISNSAAGAAYSGQGSGYYWQALKEAAANHKSFGDDCNYIAWLGTTSNLNAWRVDSSGDVDTGYQGASGVVAPAFKLDKSKVTVSGNSIVPFSESNGIEATGSSIQSIKEEESIDLSKVIDKVTYTGGSADGNDASYTVSCDKGTISGTNYTAPRDVAVDDIVTFTITSTRKPEWTSSVEVKIAQKYVNVSYDVATNGDTTSIAPPPAKVDLDKDLNASSSVLTAGKDTVKKQDWDFVGWNIEPDANEPLTHLTMDSDQTLYAIFKKDLTVTFIDAGS